MNRWGKTFVNFSPGISNQAAKAIRQTTRDWQLDCRIDKRIDDLARMFNPIIRGLDHLLWSLLQVGTFPRIDASRPLPGALGDVEISTLEEAPPTRTTLDPSSATSGSRVVRALAPALSSTGCTVGAG